MSNLIEVQKIEAPKVKRYHIGIYEQDPPVAWFVTVAGICFPVTTSKFDEAGNEFKLKGDTLELSDQQIRDLKEALKRYVVRWKKHPKTGVKVAAEVWDVSTRGFRPSVGDEPLACYLYLELAPEEFTQPSAAKTLNDDLDKALAEAQKSEDKAVMDPADKATREKHKSLRAQGAKLDSSDL